MRKIRIENSPVSFCLFLIVLPARVFVQMPLKITFYNPGNASIFPVCSEFVVGYSQMILVDAQFQRNDARTLVATIKLIGKRLIAVFVTHHDPDYYFGLDVIEDAFPDVPILAAPETVARIRANNRQKLAIWGPVLKRNAPRRIVVPQPFHGDRLYVDGHEILVKGNSRQRQREPCTIFLWQPQLKMVFGGVPVLGDNLHVWMADTQTKKSIRRRIELLNEIIGLRPKTVIPAHFLPGARLTTRSAEFTKNYIDNFVQELAKAGNNSKRLIKAMKNKYPTLQTESVLEISARVMTGEQKWDAGC